MRRPHLRRSEPSAVPAATEPLALDGLCTRRRQPRPTLVAGSLFGLALGDALGAPTEFMDVATIERCYGLAGPESPSGNPARVTEDTQMALAVGREVIAAAATGPLTAASCGGPLTAQIVAWLRSPDNTCTLGDTCLAAARALDAGVVWIDATVRHSKGCGANMRVAPVGLLADSRADSTTRAALAQFQAEEALATGLLCFLLFPDSPVAAVRRAAVTSGDSDSIACLTGAFAGAVHGLDGWPADWRHRVEYRRDIEELSAALSDDRRPPAPAAAHTAEAFCWGRTRGGQP